MKISYLGLAVDLPPGWDGRIYRRPAVAAGEQTNPVLHAANFPLPETRGDFGGGAVELMTARDAFVALVEYDAASARTPMFARPGFPLQLTAAVFAPNQLQRALPGQAGVQRFFSERGRAFCLYVVVGSYAARAVLLPQVNAVLATLQVDLVVPS